MRLHEYQAKSIFSDGGIPIPPSGLANSVETVLEETNRIGYPVVIKAQVHVGGRGKAGGITLVQNDNEAEIAANKILGVPKYTVISSGTITTGGGSNGGAGTLIVKCGAKFSSTGL